ncbi:hypothetical protein SNOG_04958 [Parastagonospora nodorum SN15]|uniref:Uncharacterized protein n=1 Tax=Phaeosphaeria nodorum (strain SN15 / ATCC MYA-4574 / FGSC 10173) TaxID=321614 RepID=Q0UTF6_PHANO|nr:hypothetical protein SNOG_04958 [Parastagonospora nodorum SN15]EAT87349.1 hypothetical protein SNOG_04958 [Parastagonospora nodorum SN15]
MASAQQSRDIYFGAIIQQKSYEFRIVGLSIDGCTCFYQDFEKLDCLVTFLGIWARR